MTSSTLNSLLIDSNIEAIEDGLALLSGLSQSDFTKDCKPAFGSSIGAHFRHTLEHYRCFFNQMQSGCVCYDKRERDQDLECDIEYTKSALLNLKSSLDALDIDALDTDIQIDDEQLLNPISTTLQRELIFLQSHTMHHYAMIGAMVRLMGKDTDQHFGVAIATRSHQQQCDDNATAPDQS